MSTLGVSARRIVLTAALAFASTLVIALTATFAYAGTGGTIVDPIGDTADFAPDLGDTAVIVNDDDTLSVTTRIVPRPPAGWGGNAYCIGSFPFQTCVPADMNVNWYFDFDPKTGSVAEGGADAKVIAIPRAGITTWESSVWNAPNGKFVAGAKPLATESADGVSFTLRLGDLAIPRPATVGLRAVSLYKSYNGLGTLLNYSDTAGPGTFQVNAPPVVGALSNACRQRASRINRLQRKIRSARRNHQSSRARKLRRQRNRAVEAMKRNCATTTNPPAAPTSAPAGCRLVTKPVLQQEGTGIFAQWVFRNQVVVECSE